MKAVIQAGGKGTRLRPYTLVLPKPLMPVSDQPVIEMLIKWLRRNGVDEVCVTIGYLGHLIQAICGDGSKWAMKIRYSQEPEPLGTIGPLRLIQDELNDTFLVLNGDLVTDLDLRGFMEFHQGHEGLVSVAVAHKDVKIDLGVIECEADRITGFREKPTMGFRVSMGIYCMDPGVLDFVPHGVPFGFDDLIHLMLEKGLPVYTFSHHGIWLDIGRPDDFRRAQKIMEDNDSLGCI